MTARIVTVPAIEGVGLRSPRGPILLSLMIATFVVSIDSTILATAVPTIVAELGGFTQFPWLFSVYLLAQAATVPVYGKLADTFGRRPVMITGIAVFLAGSVLCALAWDMTSLIAFRAVQGLGAGGILPISMTIAGDIYSVRERARVQGYLASVWAVSALAGPTLGGLFSQYVSWRWIFWIKLPICVLAIWMLRRNYHHRLERHGSGRLDYLGGALLMAGLVLVVLGLLEGGVAWPWHSWQTYAAFGGGAILLIAFALVERRAADPVLAPWVVQSRIVMTAATSSFMVGAAMIGLVSYVPTFLTATTDAAPILAGLAVAGLSLGWALSSALSGRLYLRIGFRATALIGSAVALVGTVGLVLVARTPSLPLTAAACLVVGLGLGLVANPPLIAAQSSVPATRRGVVSATNILARSVGSAVAVAVYGAIANGIVEAGGGTGGDAVGAGSTAVFTGVAGACLVLLLVVSAIPPVPISPAVPPAPVAPPPRRGDDDDPPAPAPQRSRSAPPEGGSQDAAATDTGWPTA